MELKYDRLLWLRKGLMGNCWVVAIEFLVDEDDEMIYELKKVSCSTCQIVSTVPTNLMSVSGFWFLGTLLTSQETQQALIYVQELESSVGTRIITIDTCRLVR